MITNPFLEGCIVVVLAIVCLAVGGIYNLGALNDLGQVLVGAGIGYLGGNAVPKNNGSK